MSFMKPQIIETSYWTFETSEGTEIIPCDPDGSDDTEIVTEGAKLDAIRELFGDDVSGDIIIANGYLWRLSAPGYMDCTDWAPGESIADCVSGLLGMFGDDMDWSDFQTLGDALEGFDGFWHGYLCGLAFTGHIAAGGETDCDEPLYSNPGGDIRDVLDVDEFERNIAIDERCALYHDCLSFFLSAMPYIGDSFDDAGSDFHFTRNGHGAGFWGGDWPEHGDKLTELSKPYGCCEIESRNSLLSIVN